MQKSIFGISARDRAIKGMDYLCQFVIKSIGPFGLNLLMEKGNRITNDGYTISTQIIPSIKNEFERRGAAIIHEASAKTNDQVGDATSTSEALAQAIVKECIRYLPSEGSFASKRKPSEIIQQLKKEKDEVIKKLDKKVKQIETREEIINSAKVSVEDDDLANLIGNAQWEIGKDGIILAEETAKYTSEIERIKGIKFDSGFSDFRIINNQEKGTLELPTQQSKNPVVIMTHYVIQDINVIDKVLSNLIQSGQTEIILIARAFSSSVILSCKKTSEDSQRRVNIYPVQAPNTDTKEIMYDLEAVLGGRYFDNERNQLEDMTILDIGYASKVIVGNHFSIFTGSDNDPIQQERVTNRINELKKKLKGSISEFEKKMLKARIAQLQNGFAILKVGAETDVERKRKKDKCDDAVNAVRLAYLGGTVKGGGLAFKEISDELPEDYLLKRPLKVIYEQIMSSAPNGFIIEDWVRDPILVLKSALENAISVAGVLCSINGIVATENEHQCKCDKAIREEEKVEGIELK